MWEIPQFGHPGKYEHRATMEIRLKTFGTCWRWYQYLPESMKWVFGNMGLVSPRKRPDGQCWNGQKHNTQKIMLAGPKQLALTIVFKQKSER